MKEKIKNWNWGLICPIAVMAIYYICFLFFTISLGSPVFAAMRAPDYEPTAECFYGIAATLATVFFICFGVQGLKVLDKLRGLERSAKR